MTRLRIALLLASLVLASQASAAIITAPPDGTTSFTLADVIAAGGIAVGPITFTDWHYSAISDGPASVPSPAAIALTGVLLDGQYGLRFNSNWSAGPDGLADTTISYRAICTDGGPFDLQTLYTTGWGAYFTGLANVSETAFASDPSKFLATPVANTYVYNYRSTFDSVNLDFQKLPPLTEIWQVLDIGVSGGTNGSAHISQLYNLYDVMPEPTCIVLLCAGAAMLLRRKRRPVA